MRRGVYRPQRQRAIPPDRLERLERLRRELAEAADLKVDALTPADKLRVETCVWLQLSLDNARNDILAGVTMGPSTCERISAALRDLLPPAQRDELIVRLVSGEVRCSKCNAVIEPEHPVGELAADGFVPAAGYTGRSRKAASNSIPHNRPEMAQAEPSDSGAESTPMISGSNVLPLNPDRPEPPTSVAGMVAKVNSGVGTRSPFDLPFGTRFDNR